MDDAAGTPDSVDDGMVRVRELPLAGYEPLRKGASPEPVLFLGGHRQPQQGREVPAPRIPCGGLPCCRDRLFEQGFRQGVDSAVDGLGPGDHRFHELHRRELPGAEEPQGRAGVEVVQLGHAKAAAGSGEASARAPATSSRATPVSMSTPATMSSSVLEFPFAVRDAVHAGDEEHDRRRHRVHGNGVVAGHGLDPPRGKAQVRSHLVREFKPAFGEAGGSAGCRSL